MSHADALTPPGGTPSKMDNAIVMQAAEWLVKLHSGEMSDAEREALARWRVQSVEHERAWNAACELSRSLTAIPSKFGMPVLGRQRLDRRRVLKTLTAMIAAGPAGYAGYRLAPWREWSADYRTATGEQREVKLADGSRLLLNTATAVDVVFDQDVRRVILQSGELLIETASDVQTKARPFVVQTEHGLIRALGTRFSVRKDAGAGHTEVAVLEHAVAIQPNAAAQTVVLEAGKQCRFSRLGVEPAQKAGADFGAWSRGQVIADRQRLGDFITELARYRPGVLRCDPQVAGLRISGVFQIDNTDRALSILAETLPVSLVYRTRYWVSVIPANAAS
jgi:transmembrane sensor